MFWRLSVHSGKTLRLRWISDDHDDDDDDDYDDYDDDDDDDDDDDHYRRCVSALDH